MEELAAAYQSVGEQVYVVRNGATTGRGALGYTAAVVEMKHQCEDLGIGRMTIFAPGGSGRADLRKSADGPALPHCDRQRRG